MSFGILGSGFGLYGYLPALISCGQPIVLPIRYRERFESRPELASFIDQIAWVTNEDALQKHVTGIVLALQPHQQLNLIPQCLRQDNINYLLLEKPLAESPESALRLFDILYHSGIIFRIGYLFRYTPWGKHLLTKILNSTSGMSEVTICWNFMAYHFRQNLQTWKRSHLAGGGVIRFYGIHIIALLSQLGYSHVELSQTCGDIADEPDVWHAVFSANKLPQCTVTIDSKSLINQFKVFQRSRSSAGSSSTVIADLNDPFASENQNHSKAALDNRVPILIQHCNSLWEPKPSEYDLYAAALRLWLTVEENTQHTEKEKIYQTAYLSD